MNKFDEIRRRLVPVIRAKPTTRAPIISQRGEGLNRDQTPRANVPAIRNPLGRQVA